MKKLNVREATAEDCQFLYECNNDKISRANSVNTHSFTYEEHKDWLMEKIANPNEKIYIFEEDGVRVGNIRETVNENDEFYHSTAVHPDHRGKGIGNRMWHYNVLGRKGTWVCVVEENNIASQRMLTRNGHSKVKKADNFFHYILVQ